MRVADRHGQRVGFVGLRNRFEPQNRANHVLNLFFLRAAASDNGLLDHSCRIFEQANFMSECGTNSG